MAPPRLLLTQATVLLGPTLLGLAVLGIAHWVRLDMPSRFVLTVCVIVPTATVGMVTALIWSGRSTAQTFFWHALSASSSVAYALPFLFPPAVSPLTRMTLSLTCFGVFVASSAVLGKHMFQHRLPGFELRLFGLVFATVSGAAASACLWPEKLDAIATTAYLVFIVLGCFTNWRVYVGEYLRAPRQFSFLTQSAANCMAIAAILDVELYARGMLWTSPPWFLMVGLFPMVTFTAQLLQRYGMALAQSEYSASVLEERVRDREQVIRESYERLRVSEHANAISHERERVFRDMHDGLGGTLIRTLSMISNEGARDSRLAHSLEQALSDLRLMFMSLRPAAGSIRDSLVDLVQRLEDSAEDAGMRLVRDFVHLPATVTLGPRNLLDLLRVVNEAMVNAIRHSGGKVLTISAALGDVDASPILTVTISDDGSGFDAAAARPRGRYGLDNLYARADRLGALSIDSGEGGTRVQLVMDVPVGASSSPRPV